jgi:hypothetical protein
MRPVQSLKIAGWLPGWQPGIKTARGSSLARLCATPAICTPNRQGTCRRYCSMPVAERLLPQPTPTTPAARSPAPPRGSESGPALSARAGVWAHSNGSLLNLLATSGTELLSCHMRTSHKRDSAPPPLAACPRTGGAQLARAVRGGGLLPIALFEAMVDCVQCKTSLRGGVSTAAHIGSARPTAQPGTVTCWAAGLLWTPAAQPSSAPDESSFACFSDTKSCYSNQLDPRQAPGTRPAAQRYAAGQPAASWLQASGASTSISCRKRAAAQEAIAQVHSHRPCLSQVAASMSNGRGGATPSVDRYASLVRRS